SDPMPAIGKGKKRGRKSRPLLLTVCSVALLAFAALMQPEVGRVCDSKIDRALERCLCCRAVAEIEVGFAQRHPGFPIPRVSIRPPVGEERHVGPASVCFQRAALQKTRLPLHTVGPERHTSERLDVLTRR